MKVVTWNVNSLRVRLPHVLAWLETHQPDVLALQETKLPDENFPGAAFAEIGYRALFSGQKTYNGVALLSRSGEFSERVTDPADLNDPQRRILAASVGDIRVVNLYVPNGAEVGSEKYAYKLGWLKRMTGFLARELQRWPRMIVLGDFNIAPEDRDVYDPDAWREKILCSTPEREAFQAWLALDLVDVFRCFEQPDASYTWWDFRTRAFPRNQGLRIDHILASRALSERAQACCIDIEPRKLERPSDHAPVWAEFG